ncbi:MAG TPA: M14 metallopeptidase family protein [Candidatus Acidoferrales bacterium]|nr:M14 metallopeptidase family protein [Candidatus Acidoferrales bacterium]
MIAIRRFSIALLVLLATAGFGAAARPGGRRPAQAAGAVPAPESVFGFTAGADYHLADFEQITKYFQALAAASPRIKLQNIGPTGNGRQMFIAFLSSPENLRELDRYRGIVQQLAAGKIDRAAAEKLAEEGKAIVWIDGGLHATEVAGAQHTPLVAYDLLSENNAEVERILNNVILVLCPVINPDGLDIVSHWYMKNVNTPYELAPVIQLWNRYVGHDNNRDWYMFNQVESRDVAKVLYYEWFPQIVYNQHQAGPFPSRIFVPPFADPVNPNIPAEVTRGVNLVGSAMTHRFDVEHKTGAVSREEFDMWWNGGMRTAPYYHNMIGILTETALFDYATPGYYPPQTLPKSFADGLSTQQPSIFYPSPWKGGWWHLRDAVDYMVTGDMAVLDIAARRKDQWLFNFWSMNHAQIEAGQKGGPYAYLVPPDQHDPTAAGDMLFSLQTGGIQIYNATQPFTANGASFPVGTKVLPAAQPARPFLIDLMEPQHYPDLHAYPGGPPLRPYDMTGWTLPMQMGVRVVRVDQPMEIADEPVTVAEPAHHFEPPAGGRLGRIGLYDSWMPNMDAGWTRWLLDRYGIPYADLHDADIRAGNLNEKFDVIVLPQQGESGMLHGWQVGAREGFGGGGQPVAQRPEYTGGLGLAGVAALEQFARTGGRLVALDSASQLLIQQFGLPVRNVLGGLGSSSFYCPGSLLRIDIDPNLPETRGMQPDSVAFFVNSEAFEVWDPKLPAAPPRFAGSNSVPANPFTQLGDHDGIRILALYAKSHPLMSGWLLGEQHIDGRVAAVSLPFGKGRIVLIGFRSQFRGQPENTFPLLFNSLVISPDRDAAN